MKVQKDIRHWETSKNLKMFNSRHNARQNGRTIQIIIKKKTKTKWSNKSLILESDQKMEQIALFNKNF